MTRRGDKQNEHAFYVPDGKAGEVWVLQPDDSGQGDWGVEVFENQQIGEQYADQLRKQLNLTTTPWVRKMIIHTKMRRLI
jgi:hypothetical protein